MRRSWLFLVLTLCLPALSCGSNSPGVDPGFSKDFVGLDAVGDALGRDTLDGTDFPELKDLGLPDGDLQADLPSPPDTLADTLPEVAQDTTPDTLPDTSPDSLPDTTPDTVCVPNCLGLDCGDDGCGGQCGTCALGYNCLGDGSCEADCVALCSGRTCGSAGLSNECPCGAACDDQNPCTADQCVDGVCQALPLSEGECDDLNPCTTPDLCQEGACVGQLPGPDSPVLEGCACLTGPDCAKLDDGNLCNGLMECRIPEGQATGVCAIKQGSVKQCGDGNPCTRDDCVPSTGVCRFIDDDTLKCGDADPCTGTDTCHSGKCQTSQPPVCPGDDNPCSAEFCKTGSGCVSEAVEDGTICGASANWYCDDGACGCHPLCNGKKCGSDGCGGTCGTCGVGELCTEGQCVCQPQCQGKTCGPDGCGGNCGTCAPNIACNDGNCACFPACNGKDCGADGCGGTCGTCDPGLQCLANLCLCVPTLDCEDPNIECGDAGCGLSCGTCPNGKVCEDHKCVAWGNECDEALDCDDKNPCTDEVCDHGLCQRTCKPGRLCDDGLPGTKEDACVAQGDKCVCKGTGECEFDWQCNDNNSCTEDLCTGGVCKHPCFPGALCDDGVLLTINDKCGTAGGKCGCAGTKVDCIGTGACDDNNPCTNTDLCVNNKCVGTPKNCADTNTCTDDSCMSATGLCKHVFNPKLTNCGAMGCADNSLEGYADKTTFPRLAACKGFWSNKDLRAARDPAADPNCGSTTAALCASAEDLCAPGWHICMKNGYASDIQDRMPNQSQWYNYYYCIYSSYGAPLGSYVMASSNSGSMSSCTTGAPFGCNAEVNYYSAPLCCGEACATAYCPNTVWGSSATKVYPSPYDGGIGCGNLNYSNKPPTGILCCKD